MEDSFMMMLPQESDYDVWTWAGTVYRLAHISFLFWLYQTLCFKKHELELSCVEESL